MFVTTPLYLGAVFCGHAVVHDTFRHDEDAAAAKEMIRQAER